jgi:hypothetical protein
MTMPMCRRQIFPLVALTACTAPSEAPAQPIFDLGREWLVHEQAPDGRFWDGIWRRRGDSPVFDAEWRDSLTGGIVRDVIEFRRLEGGSVILRRYGNNGRYVGELSPGGHRVVSGTASWYGPGYYWTARIVS